MEKTVKIGNGSLKLDAGFGKHFLIYGGPYTGKPKGMSGVKMAKEIRHPEVTIDIPTPDFSVPPVAMLDEGLRDAVALILKGDPVYVGCMAGRGRTGLFLAIVAKAFGEVTPVEYVREHYYPHAVETSGQYSFVRNYPIPKDVQDRIRFARYWSWLNFFKKNLTKPVKIS